MGVKLELNMGIEKIISDIVSDYGWDIGDVDEYSKGEYLVTVFNNTYGVGIAFYIEFHNPGDTYSNSYWTLDIVESPVMYDDVEFVILQIKRMWFDIEDKLYRMTYDEVQG